MPMNFQFDGSEATVALSGELTFADHEVFREIADRLFKGARRSVAIDLSRLEFIDSAGLGMLLIARDEAIKAERKVVLRNPQGQVKRIFAATNFDTLFTVENG
jgi:anti-anti-sigma factor